MSGEERRDSAEELRRALAGELAEIAEALPQRIDVDRTRWGGISRSWC